MLLDTAGSVAWADEATLFYVKHDAAHRPFQVWKHSLGTAQADDVLVYEDKDELFNVGCWRSRDGRLIFIESESRRPPSSTSCAPTRPPTRRRSCGLGSSALG